MKRAKVLLCSVRYSSPNFKQSRIFSIDVQKFPNIQFHKNPSSGSGANTRTEERTDRRTDLAKSFSTMRTRLKFVTHLPGRTAPFVRNRIHSPLSEPQILERAQRETVCVSVGSQNSCILLWFAH
jgi:hypothetical protein